MKNNIMDYYIDQQQELLNRLSNHSQFKKISKQIKEFNEVIIIGTGSSFHAALMSQSILMVLLECPIYVKKPSEAMDKMNQDSLIILISQTGTSRNVFDCSKRFENLQTLSITEDTLSPIGQSTTFTLDLLTDNENCNAKTKGVSATYVSLILLGVALSQNKNKEDILKRLVYNIQQVSSVISETRKKVSSLDFTSVNHFIFIAAASLKPIGLEAALKTMEVVLLPSIYSDADEFSHGYHRIVNSKTCLVLINSKDTQGMANPLKNLIEENHACFLESENYNSPLLSLVFIHTFISELSNQFKIDPNLSIYKSFTEAVLTRI